MIDPRLTLAIGNAVDGLCADYEHPISAERRASVIAKIERRIENGEAQDLVFADETWFIVKPHPK